MQQVQLKNVICSTYIYCGQVCDDTRFKHHAFKYLHMLALNQPKNNVTLTIPNYMFYYFGEHLPNYIILQFCRFIFKKSNILQQKLVLVCDLWALAGHYHMVCIWPKIVLEWCTPTHPNDALVQTAASAKVFSFVFFKGPPLYRYVPTTNATDWQ